jgi:hypothetical protein
MTAKEVYLTALALMDELEPDGQASGDTNEAYEKRAIRLINVFQREIAKLEGVEPTDITSLDDELSISEDSADRIMPYGLAAKFCLSDQMTDMFTVFQSEYRSLLRTIPAVETPIHDDIGILSGLCR